MLGVAIKPHLAILLSHFDPIVVPTGRDDDINVARSSSIRRERRQDPSLGLRFAEDHLAASELGIIGAIHPQVVPRPGEVMEALVKLLERLFDA